MFGARDEKKQPLTDAQFKVEVQRPDGERKSVTVTRGGAEAFAEFTDSLQPGDYWVRSRPHNGTNVGLPAMSRFIVDARDLELDNPAADPDLMAEIAAITGTVPLPPEQFGQFLEDLLSQGVSTEISRQTQINLWDNWGLLARSCC
jgi:hypothetical protein